MSEATFFIVERYLVARNIWKIRNEKAHDGFPATATRGAVPAQSYGAWFEWAYGMSLDEYAQTAKERRHDEVVKRLPSVLVDYRIGDRWMTCVAAPGETLEECCGALQRMFPQIEEVRSHG